jgi:hypothetical protein
MKAMFNFSFGERLRGAPGVRLGCSNKFPTASAEAALVELARKRRRVMEELWVVMTEAYDGIGTKGSQLVAGSTDSPNEQLRGEGRDRILTD